MKVFWEGFTEPTWESFSGFVKDAPEKVERYFLRQQIRPYKALK